ncbi:MAG TPA: SusC/RagA family protein, partial [Cytophagales bacterium]|nr:SusC/RagA family protein [Cytophagales bacterium]
MKYHIQNLLVVSRQLFYMFFIQALAMQFLFANSGNSQSLEDVTISLQMKEVRLTEIFREIEAKTDFEFAYNHKVNKVSDRLNLEVENGNLQEVLETLASKTPFNFKRINQNIYVVSREDSDHIEVSENVTKSISGKVTDTKTGEPLIGATVVVEGTSLGAITDIEGAFKLNVPDEASTLIVSFTGYLRVSVDINSQTYFEIALEEDVAQLTEVVVLGYDTQTKRDLTGSVATVNPDQVKSLPTASVDKMLDGRMAGVQVLTDNAPGGNVTVRVRGYGTINNNDPLYIVDGVPISNGLNSVNPSDIASIQVLKDASAAAIYGSRAANGVVVITTKAGSSSESKVEINAYTGVQ